MPARLRSDTLCCGNHGIGVQAYAVEGHGDTVAYYARWDRLRVGQDHCFALVVLRRIAATRRTASARSDLAKVRVRVLRTLLFLGGQNIIAALKVLYIYVATAVGTSVSKRSRREQTVSVQLGRASRRPRSASAHATRSCSHRLCEPT